MQTPSPSLPIGFDANVPDRQKPAQDLRRDAALQRLDRIADLMDSRYSIFGIRFGLDPIIGLFPVVGDLMMMGVSIYLLLEAAHLGARKRILLLMLINIFLDTLIGAVPIAGSVFDLLFKANNRNIRLLKKELLSGL